MIDLLLIYSPFRGESLNLPVFKLFKALHYAFDG